MVEKIKLAAMKRKVDDEVFTGRNHSEIILTRPKGDLCGAEQGFITDTNRFVGRSEAGEIAFFAEQIDEPTNQLFSEDITGDWPWAKEVIADLQAENARLREENRWIPVSERLPKNTDDVWMCSIKVKTLRKAGYGFYSKHCKKWIWFDRHGDKPTHWKPIILPEQALKDKQ